MSIYSSLLHITIYFSISPSIYLLLHNLIYQKLEINQNTDIIV